MGSLNVYYIPPHTRCTNCGACCGHIPITPGDYKRIHLFLKDNEYAREVMQRPHNPPECIFHDNELKRCAIYAVRPMICRLFGVAKGLDCPRGNSAEIDGHELLDFDSTRFAIQNYIDWS